MGSGCIWTARQRAGEDLLTMGNGMLRALERVYHMHYLSRLVKLRMHEFFCLILSFLNAAFLGMVVLEPAQLRSSWS